MLQKMASISEDYTYRIIRKTPRAGRISKKKIFYLFPFLSLGLDLLGLGLLGFLFCSHRIVREKSKCNYYCRAV